ncbi:MAG TPA: GAF domain-containing sensor histidine kinase, partial [Herpetosiphonaceae bacterium]
EALRLLAAVSTALVASLDSQELLEALARCAVPEFCDYCAFTLRAADGSPGDPLLHGQPAKQALVDELRRDFPEPRIDEPLLHTLESGRGELLASLPDERLAAAAPDGRHLELLRRLAPRSAIAVPLNARGRTIGAILFVVAESARRYDLVDFALAEELARRAALAIDNAQLYAEARQAVLTRDQFISIAAHELKTPITTMLGYTQLIQRRFEREGNASERDQRTIRVLHEQAERLNRMVMALLDISHIQIGQLHIEHGIVDMRALVGRIIEDARITHDRHVLHFDDAGDPLYVVGDELRLEQVVQNLLQNAMKYSVPGSAITLEVGRSDGQVRVSVADSGVGIPADALPRLFVPFFRAPHEATLSVSGMGVGLYVVKEIVSLHGGTVEVVSEEGAGSTFTIVLPVKEHVLAS